MEWCWLVGNWFLLPRFLSGSLLYFSIRDSCTNVELLPHTCKQIKISFLTQFVPVLFFPPLPDTFFALCGLALLPLTWDKQPLWWAAIIGPSGGCLWLRAISTQASAPAACLLDQVCRNQCCWGVSCSCVLQELPCQDVCTTFLLQSWQRVR